MRDIFEGLVSGSSFFFSVTGSVDEFGVNPAWHHREEEEFHAVIQIGERSRAIDFLGNWLEKNAEEFVTVVDPYFGPDDLWFVRLVMKTDPHLIIRVVTGHTSARPAVLARKSEAYRVAWRNLCDQDPPYTEILSINLVGSGKTPIHDRWILSKSAGMRLGTSFNSIGNRLTEMSVMGSNEMERIEYVVNGYLTRSIREESGERVAYELFELLP